MSNLESDGSNVVVHIFTREGSTFTFLQAKIVVLNESVIHFDYRAQSDGRAKRGTFYIKSIAGWSVSGDDGGAD